MNVPKMNVRGRQISVITIALLAALILVGSAFAIIISVRSISNTMTVNGGDFNVFTDASCTQPLSSWSWGVLRNGQPQVKTLYLMNNGDGSYVYVWWNTPDLPSGFTLTVMYQGSYWYQGASYKQMLYPGQPVQVVVTLTSSGVPSADYGYTLTFTGENSP